MESGADPSGGFAWPVVDHAALRRFKVDRIAEVMKDAAVDHLVLVGSDHIRYATDYRTQLTSEPDWFAAVVDVSGSADLFVPYVDELTPDPDASTPQVRALQPLTSWVPASGHVRHWVTSVARELTRRGARSVGYDAVNPFLLDGLRAELPATRFVSVDAALFRARRAKHPAEITLLKAASQVNTAAMNDALAFARAGVTDHEILAEAMRSQQRAGVEYVTHSVCNLRKGSGDWFAYGARLRPGDAFFFDIGCYGVGGYASDAARTGFVGEPPAAVLAAYQRLLEAHALGQSLARPGVRASHVHGEVNRYLASHGLGTTPYGIGHGIGLRLCELPAIHRGDRMDSDEVLLEGEAIALEPETTVEVDGRLTVLKVEDNFVVEHDGLRPLTTPVELESVVVSP